MSGHTCPWYLGYFLLNPLRRLYQNPDKILKSFVNEGMNILEIGPGMGYFTLPMAKLTGKTGKVFAVDLQDKMLDVLNKRAAQAGCSGIVQTIRSSHKSFNLENLRGRMDFALLFAVVHEIPDKKSLFSQVYEAMKKGGKV